jgi:hypothetical protein
MIRPLKLRIVLIRKKREERESEKETEYEKEIKKEREGLKKREGAGGVVGGCAKEKKKNWVGAGAASPNSRKK